jgi:hypothetical protein
MTKENNLKDMVVDLLRWKLDCVRDEYVQAASDRAATAAGQRVWEDHNPMDGVGGMSRCPYNTARAIESEKVAKEKFDAWTRAYDFFVKRMFDHLELT